MNMKEAAQAFEGKTTLNIADLKEVSIDVPMEERVFKEGTPDEFKVQVAIVDDKEYRVPGSVLIQLKALLKDDRTKNMKKFSVLKQGEGQKNTRYTVLPMGL